MFTKGSDQALTVEVSALSTLPSVVADDVAGLKRKSRRSSRGGHGSTNMCLISLQDSLNGLNVLNIFGGGLGL